MGSVEVPINYVPPSTPKKDGSCITRSYSCDPCLSLLYSVFRVPDLKVLAQNIVNAYRIKEAQLKCDAGIPERDNFHSTADNLQSTDPHVSSAGLLAFKKLASVSDIVMEKDMKVERNRLETFKNVWPLAYIEPSDLASVGFYYLQTGDKVKCAFCHGIIVDWAPGDDPLTEHSLHFPLCPFLMKRDVGNVPIPGKNIFLEQRNSSYPETVEPHRQDSCAFTAGSSSLPKFPKLASKQERLATFRNWHYPAVKPDDLASAGFFSTGTSDIVACFSCGGTLGHWDLDDDPWLEHKKHFQHCSYLKSTRHSTVKSSLSVGNITRPQRCQLTDISELMKSQLCVQATKLFSEKLVSEAVERQLRKGVEFRSLEELCNTILEIQDEAQKKTNARVESQNKGASSSSSDRHMCKICWDKEMGIVFLPCGHMMACPQCAQSITKCPLCRKTIERSVRAYIS